MKVYGASSSRHALLWIAVEARLKQGFTSRWPGFAAGGPSQTGVEAALMDFQDLRECDAVLFYHETGDLPGGSLIEVGFALALRKEVHALGYTHPVFSSSPSWFAYPRLKATQANLIKLAKALFLR